MFRKSVRNEENLQEQLEERFDDEEGIVEVMSQFIDDSEVHNNDGHKQIKREYDENLAPPKSKKARKVAPAGGMYTQALMENNSSSGTSNGKKDCFYKTLIIFKGHLENRLSYYPDPNYPKKVQAWKQSLKENEINPQKLLEFFRDEMKSFVETMVKTPERRIQERGMEHLASALSGKKFTPKKSPSAKSPKKKSTPDRIEGVSKNKQAKCRACKEYFMKTDECQNICPKEECQDRKCQKCDQERVLFKKKDCCKKCFEG